jgi:tryptophan-rich sensory protein
LGAWSFVEIAVLWLLIAATLVAFYRRSAPAGVLLVPYLGWVSFAAALNWTLWTMNPRILGGSP